jgi:heat shock protein HtpX
MMIHHHPGGRLLAQRAHLSALGERLRTAGLLAALAVLSAGVGYVIVGGVGLVLGALLVTTLTAIGARVPEGWVMRMKGAAPLPPDHAPWLHTRIARLAGRAGIATPALYLSPSPEANAMAVRTSEGPGALAVTRGALAILPPAELEAVLAHEVAHLRNGDTEMMQLTAQVSRITVTLLRVATWLSFFTVVLTGGGVARAAALSLLAIAVPAAVGLLRTALSRSREHAADATATALTGRPDALASALLRLERYHRRGLGVIPSMLPTWLLSHPPTRERVARLAALSRR